MAISAYLQASSVLQVVGTRDFAIRTLDRILSEAWSDEDGLAHVVAYAAGEGGPRIPGVLDDYALLVHACLDAWEQTLELRYYQAAEMLAATNAARLLRRYRRRILRHRGRSGCDRRALCSSQAAAGYTDAGREPDGRSRAAAPGGAEW